MLTDILSGSTLDFWVAEAEGLRPELLAISVPPSEWPWRIRTSSAQWISEICPRFSERWDLAGAIIEREHIMISWNRDHWIATVTAFFEGDAGRVVKGPTALVAAMRAYVLSKLGETVDD